ALAALTLPRGPRMSNQLTRPEGVSDDESPASERGSVLTRPGPVADILVVLGVFVALGFVCAVLWWLLVDPAEFTKLKSGGSMNELELAKRFNSDAWYAVIAAVAGLTAGILLTWWRSRDHVLTTLLLFVGSGVAAAVMALVGHAIGPADPNTVLATAAIGAKVPVALSVTSRATYLVWPIAALAGSLVVLWSAAPPNGGDDHTVT
ncbi:MAG: hypothetical protein ACXVXD_08290, partial [Nocardioidaceae bacterium]